MAAFDKGPAWTEFTYTTAFGTHMMKVSTVPYDEAQTIASGQLYLDLRGGAASVRWDTWADEFMGELQKMLPTTVNVTLCEACDYDGSGIRRVRAVSTETPRTGTDALTGFPISWAKAVQRTMSFKCEDGSSMRLMLFDVPARTFDKASSTAGLPSGWTQFVDKVTDIYSPVASYKGGRPIALSQIATTLNDNLRRKYGLN